MWVIVGECGFKCEISNIGMIELFDIVDYFVNG